MRHIITGNGAPASVQIPEVGCHYVDQMNKRTWVAVGIEDGDWQIIPKTSVGSTLDPNGVLPGYVGDTYVSSLELGGDGSTWTKTTDGGSNGWE